MSERYQLPPPCTECMAEPPGILADRSLQPDQLWRHRCEDDTWRRVVRRKITKKKKPARPAKPWTGLMRRPA